MYNFPYFIPRYMNFYPNMIRGGISNNAINYAKFATHGAKDGFGLFSKIGNGIQAIKKINWGGLINNTSKTLNVVNQAIPLVRQVGPMVNNVKSMVRVASIFKDETDMKSSKKVINNSVALNKSNSDYNNVNTTLNKHNNSNIQRKEEDYQNDNSPTFFINS